MKDVLLDPSKLHFLFYFANDFKMYSFILAGDYFSHLKAISSVSEWQALHWELGLLTFNLHYRALVCRQGKPEASGGRSTVLEIVSGHCRAWLVFVLTANFYGSSFPSDSSQEIREKWRTLFSCYHVRCTWFQRASKIPKEKFGFSSQGETNMLKEWDSFWGSVLHFGFQDRVSL